MSLYMLHLSPDDTLAPPRNRDGHRAASVADTHFCGVCERVRVSVCVYVCVCDIMCVRACVALLIMSKPP
jgi:hypothetical protein